MRTWDRFRQVRPDLAEAGRSLFYQHGVGLAFVATVRPDGGPRVHPMCPVITEDGLFAFIIPSPKRAALIRDGRFAMHTFPCPQNEDAFTSPAWPRRDPTRRCANRSRGSSSMSGDGKSHLPDSRSKCCSSSSLTRACLREPLATAITAQSTRSGRARPSKGCVRRGAGSASRERRPRCDRAGRPGRRLSRRRHSRR